ncbi:MAG: chemotaxis protein CheW [Geminicoccaceae bacterium]
MDGFEEFKQTFFQECDELLSDLEGHLMALDQGERDVEVLHAAFRAIHSIKGGAGAFGFDRLVAFAHTFENVLDLMREGKVELTDELVALTVRGGDMLANLVGAARTGEELEAGVEEGMLADLASAAGLEREAPTTDDAADMDDIDFTPIPVNLDEDEDVGSKPQAASTSFRISFRPLSGMLRRANEPLLIVRELKQLGALDVSVDVSALPLLDELDPGEAYLTWVFELETSAGRDTVEEVFEFVEDDCELIIEDQSDDGEPDAAAELADEVAAASPEADGNGSPAETGSPAEEAPLSAQAQPEPAKAPANGPADSGATKAKSTVGATIRVDLDRVDRLVNKVGELVITQAVVAQQLDQDLAESRPGLAQGLEQLFQHTRNLQDSVMAIRAQPVRSVFSRMPRLVRDLSAQTGKKARLEMSGEATEIDKTVIEQLNDPLTHMIRNAVDHGLEPAEDREAAGKDPEGTIHLSAEQRGGRIVIRIEDDGRGINREKVFQKAVEKGLIAGDANLTDEEIDNLVFAPGFSTADQVSNLSGRGVGMDVVKQNIQSLGGRVSLRSEPGRGSSVVLALPLTLAVLDGMIVRAGGESYIIPLTNVIESLSPQEQETSLVAGSGEVLKIRGDYIKLIDLSRVFDITARADAAQRLVVIVEIEGGGHVGLVVDEIVGQQQVVIKSLEDNFDPLTGIAGATILGDGKVALILDVTAVSEIHKPRGLDWIEPGQAVTSGKEIAA